MTLLVSKILFLNLLFFSTGPYDTINIEQSAFDEFMSRVDSIPLMNYSGRKYFQKDSNRIYFSGQTELYSAMPFQLNRISGKMDFIVIDSTNDYGPGKESWLYPEKGNKKIDSKFAFVVIATMKSKNELLNAGDLRLFMTNKYYHNGFYYIKFVIKQDIIQTAWYYKLDKNGKIIDIVTMASVY